MEVKSVSREVEEDVVGSGRRRRIHRWSRDARAACSFVSSADFFLSIFRSGYEKKIAPGRSDWVGAGRASERSSIYISFFSGQK